MVHTTGGSEKTDGGKHPRARSGFFNGIKRVAKKNDTLVQYKRVRVLTPLSILTIDLVHNHISNARMALWPRL
jgi:hypothetical protein